MMGFKKRHSIFIAIMMVGFCVILLGGSSSVAAQTDTKQTDLADTVSVYIPVVMKNFDARYAYKIFLPLLLKQEFVIEPGDWDILMSETFEGTFPSGLWQVRDDATAGNQGYQWAKRNCRGYLSGNSAWSIGGGTLGSLLICNTGNNYPNNVNTSMIYGPFSLAGVEGAKLTFYEWLNIHASDRLKWGASIDGSTFYTNETHGTTAGAWVEEILDLSNVPTIGNLIDQPNVWIIFTFVTNSADAVNHGAYIDKIELSTCLENCTITPSSLENHPGLITVESSFELPEP